MKPSNDHVYKFKPRTNNLRHLLDDNVLDDETRKMLMRDVLDAGRPNPKPSAHHAPTATGTTQAPPPHHPTSAPRQRTTLHHHGAAPSTSPAPSSDEGNANDLLGVMAQRLRALESHCATMHKELKEKAMKVIELEDKHRAERTTRKQLEEDVRQLELANADKQNQLQEMHAFLADYGLSWVGGSTSSSPSTTPRNEHAKPFDLFQGAYEPPATSQSVACPPDASHSEPGSSLDQTAKPSQATPPAASGHGKPSPPRKLPFDLALLKRNADILSSHIGYSGALPGEQPNHRQIKERDVVYVCVYANGISVNSGLFRPYGWPLCDAVINDLIEGFYPYEFKDRYPDGFPVSVIDKSEQDCPMSKAPNAGIHGLDSVNDHGYKPLTREALLRKLPEQYITANGHIVQVRASMNQVLAGGTAAAVVPAVASNGVITANTAANRQLVEAPPSGGGTTSSGAPPASDGGNVTALHVKLPQGQKVLLHMYFHNTIDEVRTELEKAAPFFHTPNGYELATVFPRKTYDDHAQTLEALGLVPNGAMMMIKVLGAPS